MCLGQRQLMKMVRRRRRDRSLRSQWAAHVVVYVQLAREIYGKAQPVIGAEVMVDTAEVSVYRVRYRIEERQATHRIGEAIGLRARAGIVCVRAGKVGGGRRIGGEDFLGDGISAGLQK